MRRRADNYFAVIPEWVLEGASPRALQLYAFLRRYADDSGRAWPARRTLSQRMSCSVNTVDRAITELEAMGALAVEPRFDEAGDRATNAYTVVTGAPMDGATPLPTDGGTGSPISGEENQSQCEPEPVEEEAPGRRTPNAVDSSTPAIRHRDLLFEALAEVAGWELTDLTSKSRGWLNGACRELRQVGASPDLVRDKARLYVLRYEQRPTPSALVKHWAALTPESLDRLDRRQLDRARRDAHIDEQLRGAG